MLSNLSFNLNSNMPGRGFDNKHKWVGKPPSLDIRDVENEMDNIIIDGRIKLAV